MTHTHDPVSAVASWLEPTSPEETITDPIVAWKHELDKVHADIERLPVDSLEGTEGRLLIARSCDMANKIEETVAISAAGLIAQIERLRDSGLDPGDGGFNRLIDGVRKISPAPDDTNAACPACSSPSR